MAKIDPILKTFGTYGWFIPSEPRRVPRTCSVCHEEIKVGEGYINTNGDIRHTRCEKKMGK